MKKNIIMILTNGFDPDVRVYKEAKYLVEKGFNVTILCWDRRCEYLNKEEESIDGIKIKRFFIPSVPGTGIKQLLPYFKFIKEVRKHLKDKEYTYLHCHDFDGFIVGMCTKKRKSKKIIFDMHEIYTSKEFSYGKFQYLTKFILNRLYKRANKIIYVNEIQIDNLKQKYKEKLILLPNYPDLSNYAPINKEKSDTVRVNYVGSIRDYNSLKALIEVGKKNKNINVGIYGMGICYEQLRNLKIPKNVTIYGKYDGIKEIAKIYRNTDILYCSYDPTNYNWKVAYPVKFYESIITLTPIIISKETVAEQFVIQNRIGESIEYGNEFSINNAIEKIISHYDGYVQSLKKISNNYQWESVIDNLNKIYGEEAK